MIQASGDKNVSFSRRKLPRESNKAGACFVPLIIYPGVFLQLSLEGAVIRFRLYLHAIVSRGVNRYPDEAAHVFRRALDGSCVRFAELRQGGQARPRIAAIRPETRWVAFYLRTKWIPGRRRCQISCFPRSIQLSSPLLLLLRFVRQIRLCARHRQINSRKARLSIEEPPNWNGGACRLSSVERRKWEDNFSRSTSGLPLPRGQMRIKRKSVSESSLDGLCKERTNVSVNSYLCRTKWRN